MLNKLQTHGNKKILKKKNEMNSKMLTEKDQN